MDHQYISTTRTKLNPCVIEYLPKQNLFVLGTYQLVEDDSELAKQYSDLESRNYRIGSLELFDSEAGTLVEQYECQFGGVFDLRLVNLPMLASSDIDLLVVAHANGILALYQLVQNEITLLRHWKTGSEMLTTVQDCTRDHSLSLIAGGNTGTLSQVRLNLPKIEPTCTDLSKLILFQDCELVEKCVTDLQSPIWFIRTYQVHSVEENHCGDNLVFIASEDQKWRVFNERLNTKLYINSDSLAGFTSLEFAPTEFTESQEQSLIVLAGSYDEYIRVYRMNYSWTTSDDNQSQLGIDSVTMLYKIHIKGAGIWRMKAFNSAHVSSNSSSSDLLVLTSAMYSGAFVLSFASDTLSEDGIVRCRKQCKEMRQLALPPQATCDIPNGEPEKDDVESKLIYGISSTPDLSTVVFASFYDKELYLFRSNNEI